MKLSGLRFFPFLFVPIVLIALPPVARASADHNARDVRLSLVQGDVRLSRGDGKHPDLKKPWLAAQSGELIECGFAVATGNGSAEIEFENGSTAYLAENSLLLFRELSSSGERTITGVAPPAGTATFWLLPADGESFSIETPTDRIQFTGPQTMFLRFDAYLDATAITPMGGKLQKLARSGMPNLQIATGETVFFLLPCRDWQISTCTAISSPASPTARAGNRKMWKPRKNPGRNRPRQTHKCPRQIPLTLASSHRPSSGKSLYGDRAISPVAIGRSPASLGHRKNSMSCSVSSLWPDRG